MSQLYRVVHTFFMVPFYLTGLSTEKQLIQLEMYTDFEEDQVLIHFFWHSFELIFYYIILYILYISYIQLQTFTSRC